MPSTSAPSTAPTVVGRAATLASTAAPSPGVTPQASSVVVPSQLPGAGNWPVLASVSGAPVMWGATNQPLVDHPDVTASYAVFDPTRLHAALFNGTQLPGRGRWNNGAQVMDAATPSLVAVFNGGFKFKHIKGGYFTEGRVKPLLDGDVTLAVGPNGQLAIGVYSRDLTNDGTRVSLRQNLRPGGRRRQRSSIERARGGWPDLLG